MATFKSTAFDIDPTFNSVTPPDCTPGPLGPKHIPWASAKRMVLDYRTNKNRLEVIDGGAGLVTMDGITITKNSIATIFGVPANNLDRNLPGELNIDSLFLMLAVKCEDAGVGKNDNDQEFTIIVGGIDTNNDLRHNNLQDFGDPCPTACPNKFSGKTIDQL